MRRANGRAGGKPRAMRDIVKAFRRPPAVRLPDRNGGFPRLSDGVAHGLRCPASPHHALLAENLGKPSLWVIISAPWYKMVPLLGASRKTPASNFVRGYARLLVAVCAGLLAVACTQTKAFLSETEIP